MGWTPELARRVEDAFPKTFVPLSLPLPTPDALLQTLSSLFRARSAMCSEQTSFSGGNLVLRAVDCRRCPSSLYATRPGYHRQHAGPCARCRVAFPELSTCSRRVFGYSRDGGWRGPRKTGLGAAEAQFPTSGSQSTWSLVLSAPSTFEYDSCNLSGIFSWSRGERDCRPPSS